MINHEQNIDYAAQQVPVNERAVDAPGAAPAGAQELGSQVIPWAVEQHPYDGPGAQTSSATCIQKLEAPPRHVQSLMTNPSKTEVRTTGIYPAVKGCDSLQREAEHRTQIQQGGRWLGIEGDGWYPVTDKNDREKFGFLDYATDGVKEKKVHGHWEPAREQFRVVVRDPRTGKVISTGKIRNFKTKIEG